MFYYFLFCYSKCFLNGKRTLKALLKKKRLRVYPEVLYRTEKTAICVMWKHKERLQKKSYIPTFTLDLHFRKSVCRKNLKIIRYSFFIHPLPGVGQTDTLCLADTSKVTPAYECSVNSSNWNKWRSLFSVQHGLFAVFFMLQLWFLVDVKLHP